MKGLGKMPTSESLYYFVGIDKSRFRQPVGLVTSSALRSSKRNARGVIKAGRSRLLTEQLWQSRTDGCVAGSGIDRSVARVSPKAEIADDVDIGPWTLIGDDVRIDAGTKIGSCRGRRASHRSQLRNPSVLLDRRGASGQKVRWRTDAT